MATETKEENNVKVLAEIEAARLAVKATFQTLSSLIGPAFQTQNSGTVLELRAVIEKAVKENPVKLRTMFDDVVDDPSMFGKGEFPKVTRIRAKKGDAKTEDTYEW